MATEDSRRFARRAAPAPAPEAVVLIHGLWLTGLFLLPFARWLRRAGFDVYTFNYPSVRLDLRENALRLRAFLETVPASTVHLVGHSLGGILIRALHHYCPDPRPGRVVTLGSPHGGSRSAEHLAHYRGWRWMMGRSVAQLIEGVPRRWSLPARDFGVVSGKRSFGLARFVYRRLPRPNDGLLTVEESSLPGAGDAIVLDTSHTGMLFSRMVAQRVIAFLRRGRFEA